MITIINLCAPALIYVAFSLTQVIIDTFKGLYNTAFFKLIVMIVITILLNALCQAGMGLISWVIVFVPFIFMSVIVAILLYVFGLDPATGKLNIKCDNCSDGTSVRNGNSIYRPTVRNPERNPKRNPKRNKEKYIDTSYSETPAETIDNEIEIRTPAPFGSSDPQYA